MTTRCSTVLLALALSACGSHRGLAAIVAPESSVVPAAGTTQVGIASWYGPGYHGHRTSSGERYDQDDLTAAHADWAFGTKVRVTLLSTGKSVVVRVNDRFPNHKRRIIDISRAAAREIGLIGPGTGRVKLDVIG